MEKKHLLYYIYFLIFFCFHINKNIAQPTIQLTTNQTIGLAPLAIQLDASSTTSSTTAQPFHYLHYTWDFGDCTGDLWTTSNKSKNTATGPIAGHLYTQPGNYTVTLKVKDSTGEESTISTNIIVQDPAVQFAGNNTVCFSQVGNFLAAPDGATPITTTDFSTVIAALGTGKRVLLQRGETWTTNSGYTFNTSGPTILGAYGKGNEPIIINNSGDDLFTLSGSTPNLKDWTFMDLDLRSNTGTVDAFSSENYHSGLTFYNIKMDGFKSGIKAAVSKVDFYDAPLYKDLAIIDCEITNIMGGNGGYGAFLGVENLLFMGNRVVDAENGEHNLRCEFLDKAVISHNYIKQPSANKHAIKIHSGIYTNAESVLHQRYSQKIILSDNEIIGGINDWNVAIGPQSQGGTPPATYDERVRDVIIEKNFFKAGTSNSAQLVLNAKQVTVRNNLFNNTDMSSSEGNTMLIFQRSIEPIPSLINVYNNTVVRLNGQSTRLIDATPDPDQANPIVATNIKYINNLVYAPNATASLIQPTNQPTHLGSHNEINPLETDFKGSTFATWEDFQLVSEGTPVDMGLEIPVFETYEENTRKNPYDIGAFDTERATEPATPDNSIQPSDTIGIGLLPVVFEAHPNLTILVAATDAFHDLCYSWDFGDSHAGTWEYSGQSQNIASGSVAGHLYTQPGTYTATLTVTDSDGNSTTDISTIVVQDPNTVFAGNKTVCISQTGDFTDAPAGSTTISTSSFSTVIANLSIGKRVLLKRGETWNIHSDYTLNSANPILLGAYGNGENPILTVASPKGVFLNLSGSTPKLNQAIFQHLDIQTTDAATIAFDAKGTCDRLTFFQLNLDGFYKGFNFSPAILDSRNKVAGIAHQLYSNITISECTMTNIKNGGSGINIAGERLICTGNLIESAGQGSHALHFPFLENAFIAHNKLANPASSGHLIELGAGDFSSAASLIDGRYTENIILAHNDLQGGSNQENVTIGSSMTIGDERVRNILIEKNFFKAGINNELHLAIHAQNVRVQNNLFNLTGMSSQHTAIAIEQSGNEPPPNKIFIYNNTAVGLDNSTFTFIRAGSNATSIDYCNNLGYAPTATTPVLLSGGGMATDCGTNSIYTDNPGFTGTDFDLSNSFTIDCTSDVVGAGTPLFICDDFAGMGRVGEMDLGASGCVETDCISTLMLSGTATQEIYQAGYAITSTANIIDNNTVTYQAGNHITLKPGFQVALGSEFYALIANCTTSSLVENSPEAVLRTTLSPILPPRLVIMPNPFTQATKIQFLLNEATKVRLEIFGSNGQKLKTLIPTQVMTAGAHQQLYQPHQLSSGVYWCRLITDSGIIVQKMILTKY